MQILRTVAATGAALVALAGVAAAQAPARHVMTVALPGGGVERIYYTGNFAPRVVVDAGVDAGVNAGVDSGATLASLFGPQSPFAAFEQISAEMDRQAALLLREAEAVPLTATEFQALPAGSQGYSFTSTSTGNGVCMRSVEITSLGNGATPRVAMHASGNCAPTGGSSGTVGLPAARPQAPHRIMVDAHGSKPSRGLVRLADWRR